MTIRLLQRVVFAGAFAMVGIPATAAVIEQEAGANAIGFEAEEVDEVLNPDAANDVQSDVQTGSPESPARVWSITAATGASGGLCLQAPPSPHRQNVTTALQESVAVYRLRFATAGSYKLYLKASNNGTAGNGSSDSLWRPAGFGTADPAVNTSLPDSGNFEWLTGLSGTFTVSAGQVDQVLELRFGVRESSSRIDGIVLSTQTNLNATQLEEILTGIVATPTPSPTAATPSPSPTTGPSPTGTPAPGEFFVSNVSQFNSAMAQAQPGNTIILASGVWNNSSLLFEGSRTANGTGGTAEAPIRLRAQQGGAVVFTGTSTLRISGNYMWADGLKYDHVRPSGNVTVIDFKNGSRLANNCKLSNTQIVDSGPANPAVDFDWVGLYGTNNTVEYCWFQGMPQKGVTMVVWPQEIENPPAPSHRIAWNYFADRPLGDGNGWETIRIGDSDTSVQDTMCRVEYNLFERCDGEIELISNKSRMNFYIGNTFRDNQAQLTLRHGGACTVEGNFFFGGNVANSGGVRVIGPDHVVVNNYFQDLAGTSFNAAISFMNGVPNSPLNRYLRAERATVAYNTFVNCRQAFVFGLVSSKGDTTLVPTNCTIADNIILMGSGQQAFVYVSTPTNMTYAGNQYEGGALGIGATAGIAAGNLLLAADANGMRRPGAGSSAIGAAANAVSSVATDIDLQARPVSGRDAGADETDGTGPTTRRPLRVEDVGPDWLRPTADVSGNSFLIR